VQGTHPPTICVIEDDEAVRDSLSELLKSHGLGVRTFSSALDFLTHRAAPQPDYRCVMADLHMPGMSGLELFELLQRRSNPPPFIMMTGRGRSVLKERARWTGVAALLDKPIEEAVLLDAIGKILTPTAKGA
jgi:FixJ family two-component response regulator